MIHRIYEKFHLSELMEIEYTRGGDNQLSSYAESLKRNSGLNNAQTL